MLQTERFDPKPGNPYRVIAVQEAEHHANLRVTIAMSGGDRRILTVLGKTAQELGGIRPGDDLIFGEHATLVRVVPCNTFQESCINAKSQADTDGMTQQDMHRMALECGAINALANAVESDPHPGKAKETGEAMRAAIDALLGVTASVQDEVHDSDGEGDFYFEIGVTVSGTHDSEHVVPHVTAAVEELLHSRDFRGGTISRGQVAQYKADFDRIVVTTKVNYGRRPTGHTKEAV